jgi:hypothetical protein
MVLAGAGSASAFGMHRQRLALLHCQPLVQIPVDGFAGYVYAGELCFNWQAVSSTLQQQHPSGTFSVTCCCASALGCGTFMASVDAPGRRLPATGDMAHQ